MSSDFRNKNRRDPDDGRFFTMLSRLKAIPSGRILG
jgi:hypothetical protein